MVLRYAVPCLLVLTTLSVGSASSHCSTMVCDAWADAPPTLDIRTVGLSNIQSTTFDLTLQVDLLPPVGTSLSATTWAGAQPLYAVLYHVEMDGYADVPYYVMAVPTPKGWDATWGTMFISSGFEQFCAATPSALVDVQQTSADTLRFRLDTESHDFTSAPSSSCAASRLGTPNTIDRTASCLEAVTAVSVVGGMAWNTEAGVGTYADQAGRPCTSLLTWSL